MDNENTQLMPPFSGPVSYWLESWRLKSHALHCRPVATRGAGEGQVLADQLTLFQTGGHIMSTTLLRAPRIFRPSDGPAA